MPAMRDRPATDAEPAWPLLGYVDPLTARRGETLHFMVSSAYSQFQAELVRLYHGDLNPAGPGLRIQHIPSALDGTTYHGQRQPLRPGSYVHIPKLAHLEKLRSLQLTFWLWPTRPGQGRQCLVHAAGAPEADRSPAQPSRGGFALWIDSCGCLTWQLGGPGTLPKELRLRDPLLPRRWYLISAAYDAQTGEARLIQRPQRPWPAHGTRATSARWEKGWFQGANPHLWLAAAPTTNDLPGDPSQPRELTDFFNGKLEEPTLFDAPLTDAQHQALFQGQIPQSIVHQADLLLPGTPAAKLIASWDFSRHMASEHIEDIGPHNYHGQAHQAPTRAMSGHRWNGQQFDAKQSPQAYGAIHFHEDDLEDARWQPSFSLTLPQNLPSGIYAARLWAAASASTASVPTTPASTAPAAPTPSAPDVNAADVNATHVNTADVNAADADAAMQGERTPAQRAQDLVPFFVLPPPGQATAKAAFLLPTNSYLAYANESIDLRPYLAPLQVRQKDQLNYIRQNQLRSLYDRHSDDSGVCYASRLRPIVNLKPTARSGFLNSPHQFAADLHLEHWLHEESIAHDILTDEALHHEGLPLLARYQVILTGSHPEYWTTPMRQALEDYLEQGGRLMYLGGNGFYWVTAINEARPHLIEVRRWSGTRAWHADPGEHHLSLNDERGGTWRERGNPPNLLSGIAFSGQGFDRGSPYQRLPDSQNPRAAFIFEGLQPHESIGDTPSLVLEHGAAGFELDRYDPSLPSPPHVLHLARSHDHNAAYQHAIEEVLTSNSRQSAPVNRRVRADIVFFETQSGGAVFSVGSIAWCGALSFQNRQNAVSTITRNVLKRFLEPQPFLVEETPPSAASASLPAKGGAP